MLLFGDFSVSLCRCVYVCSRPFAMSFGVTMRSLLAIAEWKWKDAPNLPSDVRLRPASARPISRQSGGTEYKENYLHFNFMYSICCCLFDKRIALLQKTWKNCKWYLKNKNKLFQIVKEAVTFLKSTNSE